MHRKTGIAIAFLKYNDPQQSLENLIAGLIKQLIQDIDTIPEPLQNLYEQHNAGETPASWKEILALFQSQVKTYDKVYLLVDGLDETTEETRWSLTQSLLDLPENIHLMFTSR